MRNRSLIGTVLLGILVFIQSCKTDDVDPTLTASLSSSQISITEAGGTATITAKLNAKAPGQVTITLLTSGTATANGTDYTISGTTIQIAEGSQSGSVVVTAVQDTSKEGNESIDINIASANGAEISESTAKVSVTIEDDDGVSGTTPQIIVNEICYDPSNNALDGDANGDGVYAQADDEFIEFINTSTQPVDMSGFMIYDSEALDSKTPRHTIPAGTIIQPGKALVVFGGGTPSGSFGGATVQTSTTGDLNLNNAGDIMTLTDASEKVLVTLDIEPLSNNPNESYTRNPDISGEFEQHGASSTLLFSPGTKIDGTPF